MPQSEPFVPAPFARAVSPGGLQRTAAPPADAALTLTLRGGAIAGYGPGPLASGLTLDLVAGAIVALVGPAGAGKSVLLEALRLARPLLEGRLDILGQDPAKLGSTARARLKRRFGVLHQAPKLLDHLGVIDNIALPMRLAGQPDKDYLEDVKDLVDYLGLGGVTDRPAAALSAGERRRTALARALIVRPAILFADAPLEGGTTHGHERTMTLIQQIARAGASVALTAQTPYDVERLAHKCFRLEAGRLEPVW